MDFLRSPQGQKLDRDRLLIVWCKMSLKPLALENVSLKTAGSIFVCNIYIYRFFFFSQIQVISKCSSLANVWKKTQTATLV